MAINMVKLARTARTAFVAASRDLANRLAGHKAELAARLAGEPPVDDVVLAERVRAQLGRWLAKPQGVLVIADAGRVRLGGRVLAGERGRAVAAAAAVRGVREVEDALEGPVDAASPVLARVPALPRRWPAGWRLIAGGVGLGLALVGASRRGAAGMALGAAGAVLGARAAADQPLAALVGLGPADPVRVAATVRIDAPIERVFTAWSDLERFPGVMAHVRDVVVYGDGRQSCWLVDGPAGVPFEFDAEITELLPNDTIAWRSLPGSAVRHHGAVRFRRDRGGTRVHVRITYDPPAGALGTVLAASLGADPARLLRADMLRLKRRLEADAGPLAAPDHQIRTRSAGAL